MALRPRLRLHHLGTGDAVEASVSGRADAAACVGEAMSLDAMKQALEALERGETKLRYQAIETLRAAIDQTHGDWDEVEALRGSLREHMAEIKRLRAVIETNLRDDRRGEKNT